MPNPFYYAGYVPPEQFVGRSSELAAIFGLLEVADTKQLQSVSIVGPRRIGKSSLLRYIANCYPRHLTQAAQYRLAYVDLQSAECKTRLGLLRSILQKLQLGTSNQGALTLEKFEATLRNLKKHTKPIYPVICLDEFEKLGEYPDEFGDDLFDSWRSLMNEYAVAFITASHTSLSDLANRKKLTSQFFNMFSVQPLNVLTASEVQILVTRGKQCDRPFSEDECQFIISLAGNHPYKLQLAGSLLYRAKESARADREHLRKQFEFQVEQIELNTSQKTLRIKNRALAVLRWLCHLPEMLGRAILEGVLLRKKDDVSSTTAWIVGAGLIIVLIALVLDWIQFSADDLWKLIERTRGTGK
jgi:hypothetical protein